ncbi:MAG: hypothetical protein AAGA85_04450, partial [Bacteroidota bacterium]
QEDAPRQHRCQGIAGGRQQPGTGDHGIPGGAPDVDCSVAKSSRCQIPELGKVDKAVMIKRGISGTIDELLYSAEYVFSGGNENLLLCERGIRTYEKASRNTFDINAIPILKEKTHLPVVADPSHGIGIREHVGPIALAATMAGADGVIFEIHNVPEEAFSDGQQTLNFTESAKLIEKIKQVLELRDSL